MVQRIVLAGFVALLPAAVLAQMRGSVTPMSHPAVSAPHVAASAPRPAAVPVTAVPRILVKTGATHARVGTPVIPGTRRSHDTHRRHHDNNMVCGSDFVPVPGLGFDIPHLAATQGAAAVGGLNQRCGVPFFFPFFDGGFFLPNTPLFIEDSQATEAEAVEAEQPRKQSRPRVFEPAAAAPPAPPVEAASIAPRETEEYVFVRLDGTVFFAVAFAWEDGMLRYVTPEGLRRAVPREALDLNATQQFNEQRGLNFRLPA